MLSAVVIAWINWHPCLLVLVIVNLLQDRKAACSWHLKVLQLKSRNVWFKLSFHKLELFLVVLSSMTSLNYWTRQLVRVLLVGNSQQILLFMNLQYLFGSIVLSIRTALLQIRYFDVEISHKILLEHLQHPLLVILVKWSWAYM